MKRVENIIFINMGDKLLDTNLSNILLNEVRWDIGR